MLPYDSMGEAVAALGRNLTAAEVVWFQYSAGMHDVWLYVHNIVFLLLVYTAAPLPVALAELLHPGPLRKHKIQPAVCYPVAEVVKCYKSVVKTFILTVGPLVPFSFPIYKWAGIRTGLPLPSAWEVVAQLAVYFVVEDYVAYWIHRGLHGRWAYEHIHRVHHEFKSPIGFAAPYAHWAEVIILGFPAFLGPAIVPGHVLTFWLWYVLRQVEAIELHSGYDFPRSPTRFIPFYIGPEFHDYHHRVGGQSQSNFGSVFTYCDYIYGTDKGYKYHKRQLSSKLRQQEEDGKGKIGEENGEWDKND